MDVAHPYTAVCPTLDSDVLSVLAGTTRPLTGREVARMLSRASHSGVLNVLNRLAEHGLVDRQEAGRAFLFTLNREHWRLLRSRRWRACGQSYSLACGGRSPRGRRRLYTCPCLARPLAGTAIHAAISTYSSCVLPGCLRRIGIGELSSTRLRGRSSAGRATTRGSLRWRRVRYRDCAPVRARSSPSFARTRSPSRAPTPTRCWEAHDGRAAHDSHYGLFDIGGQDLQAALRQAKALVKFAGQVNQRRSATS